MSKQANSLYKTKVRAKLYKIAFDRQDICQAIRLEPKGNLTLPPTSKPTALLGNFNLIIKKKRGEKGREEKEGGREE